MGDMKEKIIAHFQLAIKNRDNYICQLEFFLSKQDQLIGEQNQEISELHQELLS